MRYRVLTTMSLVLLLGGCFGEVSKRPNPATYDFTSALTMPATAQPSRLSLRHIEVQAPTWLELPAMQYVLAYANAARREAYAESRWVAPPARLLERAVARRLLFGSEENNLAGCRLRVELDEFVQKFDTPGSSQALVEVRAMLLAPRANDLLLRRSFRLSVPAGADARAGVLGFSGATRDLGNEIAQWLNQAADGMPGLIQRCRLG